MCCTGWRQKGQECTQREFDFNSGKIHLQYTECLLNDQHVLSFVNVCAYVCVSACVCVLPQLCARASIPAKGTRCVRIRVCAAALRDSLELSVKHVSYCVGSPRSDSCLCPPRSLSALSPHLPSEIFPKLTPPPHPQPTDNPRSL